MVEQLIMAAQHTPGPWIWGKNFNGLYGAGPNNEVLNYAAYEGMWLGNNECTNANARLIAAAPDLLEACQTFAEWLRREDDGFDHKTHDRETPEGEAAWRKWFYENLRICDLAQNQARAAIAKATGAAQ